MHAVDTSDEEFFIGSVNVNGYSHDAKWYETVNVKNIDIHFQLDTGAKRNVLSSADLKKIDKSLKVVPTFSPVKSFSGHYIRCTDTVILPCVWKEAMLPYVKFYIIDQTVNPVLGSDTCSKLGLIQRIHSIERKNRAVPYAIPQDYQDLFSGLGCLPGTYSIKVDKNIQPVIHPPRKIPIALKDKVKEELDRMEREGVIVKKREPTRWVNPMVTVTKPKWKDQDLH